MATSEEVVACEQELTDIAEKCELHPLTIDTETQANFPPLNDDEETQDVPIPHSDNPHSHHSSDHANEAHHSPRTVSPATITTAASPSAFTSSSSTSTTPSSSINTPSSSITTPVSSKTTPTSTITTPNSLVTTPTSSVTTPTSPTTASTSTCSVHRDPPAMRPPSIFAPYESAGSTGGVKSIPDRRGIFWRKGERVQAMDYLQKWYPAKLMEVNRKECTVLIHFEGWNQRYDEWVPMSSEGIRPIVRHSERKERVKKDTREFKIGEKVLAKWTDCKNYPAKVSSVNENGSLEVTFFDGFQKTVQLSNVKMIPEKKQPTMKPSAPSAPSADVKKSRPKDEVPKVKRENTRSTSVDGIQDKKKSKLIVAGSFLAKRDRAHSVSEISSKSVVKKKRFGLKSPVARKIIKSSPVRFQKAIAKNLDKSKRKSTEGVKRAQKRALSLPVVEGSDGCVQITDPSQSVTPSSAPAVPIKRFKSAEKDKGVARKEFIIQPDHNHFKCLIAGCVKSFRKESLLDYHLKYYHMDDGQTPQRPSVPRVKRRKTVSICSTDSDISVCSRGKITPEASGTKRKRNVSSTSDIVKRELIEDIKVEEPIELVEEEKIVPLPFIPPTPTPMPTPTVPLTVPVPSPVVECVKLEPNVDVGGVLDDSSSTHDLDDELAGDEVVNCVCGFNEENGLMIQCDVCLCWQHATCFNIKYESLPSKYICFVCENPPGIRDSKRYIHDQDWHKHGQLRPFKFLNVKPTEDRSETLMATSSLIADVLNVKAVLHSLRFQNKVSSDEKHPEMKTWLKICLDKRRKAKVALATAQRVDHLKRELRDSETEDVTHHPLSIDKLNGELEDVDKLCEATMADNDSDTSTMTASESSTGGYMGNFEDDMPLDGRVWKEEPLEDDENDPVLFEECESNLLIHIVKVQSNIGDRLDLIEEQIAALERADKTEPPPLGATTSTTVLSDVPVIKKSLHTLVQDLCKVKTMATYH